jgi:hypothetical protein
MKVFLINGAKYEDLFNYVDEVLARNPEPEVCMLSSDKLPLDIDFFDTDTGKRCQGAEAMAELVKERQGWVKAKK